MTIFSSIRNSRVVPIAVAIAFTFTAQIFLALNKSVNWDEFFHFQYVHQLKQGTLTQSLQIFYIHFVSWTADLPMNTIDQLLVGRVVLLFSELVLIAAIYGITRRFAEVIPALFCALAYVTAGFVFTQMSAFRPDAVSAATLMTALWILTTKPLSAKWALGLGALVALAMICTVKSLLYVPAFIGIAWLRYSEHRQVKAIAHYGLLAIISAALFFTLLYAWHSLSLTSVSLTSSSRDLGSARNTVFSAGLFPQGIYLAKQILIAPLFALMVAASVFLIFRGSKSAAERLALVGLAAPLLTVLFYRNSYAYNYVFILAPVAVTLYPAAEILIRRFGVVFASALCLVQPAVALAKEPYELLDRQKQILSAVREIFPEPVAYVDFSGIIADYPRVFPFLTSGWGLHRYRDAGMALLEARLKKESVPLIIANDPSIEAALRGIPIADKFLPADQNIMRNHYIQHWGPLWVSGYHLNSAEEDGLIDVASPGRYTVEGGPVLHDNRVYAAGAVIELARGPNQLVPSGNVPVTLRWGDKLRQPKIAPPPPGPRGMFGDY